MGLFLQTSSESVDEAANQSLWELASFSDAIALFSLVVAAAAYGVAWKSHRSTRDAFVAEMRDRWGHQRENWNLLLMLLNGPSFYYAYASDAERHRAVALLEELNSEEEAIRDSAQKAVRKLVLPVADFLATAGDALLNRRWSIAEAYELFGPDAARHYIAIMWLARRPEATPSQWGILSGSDSTQRTSPDPHDQIPEFNTYDRQDCLVLLAICLRAEQCRRGDTYPHFRLQLAHALRCGSTAPHIYTAIKRAHRVRSKRPFWSTRIFRLLRRVARPSLKQLRTHDPKPIIDPAYANLVRRRPLQSKKRWRRENDPFLTHSKTG